MGIITSLIKKLFMVEGEENVGGGEVIENTVVAIVRDQTGEEVERFSTVAEAYAFAGENGYQVEVR